jgi:mono/diheme cytochrome c family protein
MRMKIVTILAVMLSLTVAYAAGDANQGKTAYSSHCQNCHGATGVANEKIAKMMKTEIPNLSSPAVQKMSDQELAKVITAGKGKMPPIRSVTGKAVDDVVAYIRTLKK